MLRSTPARAAILIRTTIGGTRFRFECDGGRLSADGLDLGSGILNVIRQGGGGGFAWYSAVSCPPAARLRGIRFRLCAAQRQLGALWRGELAPDAARSKGRSTKVCVSSTTLLEAEPRCLDLLSQEVACGWPL